MVSHFGMEGQLRCRNLRNTLIDVIYMFDKLNPFEQYDDEDFRMRFRRRKDLVIDLVKHQTRTGLPLTPMVLIALRFYGTGTLQRVNADLFGVSLFPACFFIH